ncbi:WD40 repeat-like protein [Dendrothele bispora CBS 962.96]|uniref:WD40 repeat-like protein n=1 Tax=Dendrothele bispora (strain CBS 962.96) TaxID=1314807 RepID=A0A4S8LPP0_DENBC|nr:WD40 repeat-like protein [Dendrothele bispora CBS 962.96]
MGKHDKLKNTVKNTAHKIFGNKERNDIIKDSLEASLKILKESSDFNPILKAAVGGVCASLELLNKKSKNKKDMIQMTADLAAKAKELASLKGQGNSSEVENYFEELAGKLQLINTKLREKLDHSALRRTFQADHDAGEIENNCQELQTAYDQCKTQILFKIERDTTKIEKDTTKIERDTTKIERDTAKIVKTLITSKLRNSEQAPHNVGPDKTPCTDGTRVTILNEIMDWVQDSDSPNASLGYWMCGMAGTGKSTIAKSLCLMLEEQQLLAGSFFCSRQIPECRDYHHVIPTIAYQLAYYSCTFGETLEKVLEEDQSIALKEPSDQVKKLLIQPWEAVKKTGRFGGHVPVIVIDALDECENVSEVLKAIVPAIQNKQMPGLKFFFTSRPGKNVSSHLEIDSQVVNSGKVKNFYLHDVEKNLVQEDIRKFLKNKLQDVTDEQIQILVNSSGKLFIYAATTVKYIKGAEEWQKRRLHEVLHSAQGPNPLHIKPMDVLYSKIFEGAISVSERTAEERKESLKVAHTVVSTATPVTCDTISQLLGYDIETVQAIITSLQSVMYINKKDNKVYTFHASFVDYIFSAERSKENYCDQLVHQVLLEEACLSIMDKKLHFNMCNLPSSFLLDKEVEGIEKRIAENIPGELEYCCFFWAYHLEKCPVDEEMISMLEAFIQKKMIFWIEAMFFLDKLPLCLDILEMALKIRLSEENKDMMRQIREMVNMCALGKIQGRTPQLYLSIVPFFMEDIPIFDRFQRLMKVKKAGKRLRQLGSWSTPSRIECLSLSPDGSILATGLENGDIMTWDTKTGLQKGDPFQGHSYQVTSVAFSPDGEGIVSGSWDNTVRVWNAKTGAPEGEPFQGHSNEVTSVAFSPDGERIVSGSKDNTVWVWNARTGAPEGDPFQGHSSWVSSVAFCPDEERIVSGSYDNTVRVWNVKTGAPEGNPFKGHGSGVTSVAFSPDGERIVSGSYDNTVRVWNARTGAPEGDPFQGHSNQVSSVAFSPDGERIVSGSYDDTVRVWNARTGAPEGDPFQGHSSWVTSGAFFPDEERIVSGSYDNTVRVWNARTGTPEGDPLQGHSGSVTSVAFSSDGERIVSGSDDNTVRVWNARTGNPEGDPFQGHSDFVTSVAFSPDGERIVSGSQDSTVRVWNAKTGAPEGDPFQGHSEFVTSVAFSSNGERIVSGSWDNTVRVWNAWTSAPEGNPFQGHRDVVTSVAFSPDGERIVSGSYDKTVRVWNARTGAPEGDPFQGHSDSVRSVTFSPDGERIVSGSDDKTVRVWNARTGAPEGDPFQGHSNRVTSVAFTPDGERIVSGSYDKTVRVWNARTGAPEGDPFQGHSNWVTSVAFSPDGERIVSGSFDNTVRVWSTQNVGQNNHWTLDNDGWVSCPPNPQKVFWIPPEFSQSLSIHQNPLIISQYGSTNISFDNCVYGDDWAQCYSGSDD